MKRNSRTRTQILLWTISVLVIVGMLCGLVAALLGPAQGGSSMLLFACELLPCA
jgi:hypothetical protein